MFSLFRTIVPFNWLQSGQVHYTPPRYQPSRFPTRQRITPSAPREIPIVPSGSPLQDNPINSPLLLQKLYQVFLLYIGAQRHHIKQSGSQSSILWFVFRCRRQSHWHHHGFPVCLTSPQDVDNFPFGVTTNAPGSQQGDELSVPGGVLVNLTVCRLSAFIK